VGDKEEKVVLYIKADFFLNYHYLCMKIMYKKTSNKYCSFL